MKKKEDHWFAIVYKQYNYQESGEEAHSLYLVRTDNYDAATDAPLIFNPKLVGNAELEYAVADEDVDPAHAYTSVAKAIIADIENEGEDGEGWWTEGGVPLDFDIQKIAKASRNDDGWIHIIDDAGNDISGEYMSKANMLKDTLVTSAKTLGDRGLEGIKLAGAQRMNEVAYNRLKPMMAGYGINPDDPTVKAAIMMALPALLHPLASTLEGHVPHAEYIQKSLEYSFTETVRENSAALVGFATSLFEEMYLANKPLAEEKIRIEINYGKYNKTKLKEMAKERGMRIKTNATVDDLVSLLQEADREAELLEARREQEAEEQGQEELKIQEAKL